jgi:hypothetical protein
VPAYEKPIGGNMSRVESEITDKAQGLKKKQAEKDKQLKALALRFRNNQNLRQLRGQMGVSLAQWLINNTKAKTISAAKRALQTRQAGEAVLNNHLFHLQKAGQNFAVEELSKALSLSGYIMEREVVEDNEQVQYTLYMPEPEKTLQVIEFARHHLPSVLVSVAKGHRVNQEFASTATLANYLLQALPSLRGLYENHFSFSYHQYFLPLAYINDVIFSFPPLDVLRAMDNCRNLDKKSGFGYDGPAEFWPHYMVEQTMDLFCTHTAWKQQRDQYRRLIPAFTFFVRGSKQETLTGLGDPEGRRVAAWEFSLPDWLENGSEQFKRSAFVFLPQAEHNASLKQFPTQTSLNVDHGFCVRLLEDVAWRPYWSELHFG